jgi:hypothetical protein
VVGAFAVARTARRLEADNAVDSSYRQRPRFDILRKIPRGEDMRTCWAVLWVALATSCGGDREGDVSEPYASGTRLRAKLFDGAGNAVMFGGWHDTALDLDCRFRLMDDGTWRCIPVTQVTAGFADAACTQPIVVDFTDASCAPPASALEVVDATGCEPTRYRMIGVGERLGNGPLFLQTTRGCEDYSVLAPYQRFAAGSALDVSGFVTATSDVEDRGGGLAVTAITATDGTRELVEMIDPRRGPCTIYDLTDAGLTCVANVGFEGSRSDLFVDDSCTIDAPAVYPACDDRLPGAVFTNAGLRMPGARISGPVHEGMAGTCTLAVDKSAYEIGPDVMLGDLPAIAEVPFGDGRLHARHHADVHGRPLLSAGFYDTAEESYCEPMVAGGTLRCVPLGVTRWSAPATLFADQSCTVRVIALEIGFLERVAWMEPWCGGHREIASLHAVVSHGGAVYESLALGSCTPAVRDSNLRYFADGAELPFDTLPLVTLRVD